MEHCRSDNKVMTRTTGENWLGEPGELYHSKMDEDVTEEKEEEEEERGEGARVHPYLEFYGPSKTFYVIFSLRTDSSTKWRVFKSAVCSRQHW